VAAQARDVDRAGRQKREEEALCMAGSKSRLKNRPQSMDETQGESPKFCFFFRFPGIHISFTESGAILSRAQPGR
jgi:hypothetical protein